MKMWGRQERTTSGRLNSVERGNYFQIQTLTTRFLLSDEPS